MLHLLLPSATTTTTTVMPPATNKPSAGATSRSSFHHNHTAQSLLLCKHSPSATLDLLILILVLFSGTFLLSSYFSYLFNSLSLLLSHFPSLSVSFPAFVPLLSWIFYHERERSEDEDGNGITAASYLFAFAVFFAASLAFFDFCCGPRSRKCQNPNCKGMKKAMEFDLQLQTEDCVKSGASKEIDRLPWKGGSEINPDYECLRAELRKMAPPNGRAVLLFRARCGCPIAKLEGWGPKRSRRHKKNLAASALTGADHR